MTKIDGFGADIVDSKAKTGIFGAKVRHSWAKVGSLGPRFETLGPSLGTRLRGTVLPLIRRFIHCAFYNKVGYMNIKQAVGSPVHTTASVACD